MNWQLKSRNLAAIVVLGLVCISCGPEKRPRLAIAFVIDMTGSIEQEAIREALQSLSPLFDSKKLQRGDSIYIIPVTGDTLTESQGKILRVHLNENRQVYDSDLTNLASEVKEGLKRMQAEAIANPYQHSDILGAADLAAEELSNEKGKVRKVIVILSDFIQDDSNSNFKTSPDLANEPAATELAKRLSTSRISKFTGTAMYLGFLRSKDLRKMPNARRETMKIFWQQYFANTGAQSISSAIDGPGQLPGVVSQSD
jgi:hypothetical protein